MTSVQRAPFYKRVGITFLAGLPGVVALAVAIYLTVDPATYPGNLSRPMLALLSAVNPAFLLTIACLIGAYTAPRVGLRSHLLDRVNTGDPIWPELRNESRLAAGIGIVGGVAILLLDALFAPFITRDLPESALASLQPSLVEILANIPVRFLYGGVTEELLLRFGLLSALAFLGWILTGRPGDGPSAAVMWVAILVSAVLFGAGHLPALAQTVDLTPLIIARTILLNALLGVAFGWLYWRRSLEAAMVAHMAAHVPLALAGLAETLLL